MNHGMQRNGGGVVIGEINVDFHRSLIPNSECPAITPHQTHGVT